MLVEKTEPHGTIIVAWQVRFPTNNPL